jgi:hypothetical protein
MLGYRENDASRLPLRRLRERKTFQLGAFNLGISRHAATQAPRVRLEFAVLAIGKRHMIHHSPT